MHIAKKAGGTRPTTEVLSAPNTPITSRPTVIMIGALFIGLAIRGYVVVQPPSSAMLWDHHEYVRWGVLMHEEGFAALYDHPPRETLMCDRKAGACGVAHHPKHFIRRACNYPPLAGWVLYAQIEVLRWFDPSMASNTVAARVIYAWLSMIGDCLIAAGCFVIVRRFGSALAGAVAFAVILLAPPFVIDSARWTQTDSWVLAPLVWAVWAMLSRRWLTAGLLWGVALGLKTQGILLAPVCGFAFILGPQRPRMVLAGLLAVMVLFLASIPFTLHSGLKWFEEAYVNNLVGLYKDTTLKAFNVWYVDLLLCENLDASLKLLGLEKDTWGKFLLATVMFGSAILLIRRRACYRSAILTFTAATLLAAVLLPTRVHERYIILPIPFLVMAAMWRPRMWLALVPFLAAASVQMTALDWLGRTRGAGSWPEVLQWHKTQTLPELNEEYEYLRTALPKEDFARLLPPEEHLEKICRTQYLKVRAEVAPKEWALTVVEIISAGVLFVLLLLPLHGVRNDDGLA